MRSYTHDPDGIRLPIKIDNASNGEFVPLPLEKRCAIGNRLALEDADAAAKKLGQDRRTFLIGACGAASTLLSLNAVNAAAGKTGSYFDVPSEARYEPDAAAQSLEGDEFIFDVHGHFINPHGAWRDSVSEGARPFFGLPKVQSCLTAEMEGLDYLECLSGDQFVKDVFVDSDTDMMVLTFVPSPANAEPLKIEEAEVTKKLLNSEGSSRLLVHGRVNPNQAGDLETMDELAEKWKVSAWKTYTQWGPEGVGFWLDDAATGIPFLEKARALGIKNIAVHKGIPFGQRSYEHSRCDDIGRVAKRYPDLNFLVYHSGFVPGKAESAFEEGAGKDGIDALVQSLLDNDIAPNQNVYADLGSTWRMLMQDPDSAAHAMGKLLKYVGEESVVWGTDSIWYGSPQDQIQAFRSFQISEELRERHGYPEITSQLRAKVFGLNAAKPYKIDVATARNGLSRDALAQAKQAVAGAADPHFLTFGPKSRREFLAFRRAEGE